MPSRRRPTQFHSIDRTYMPFMAYRGEYPNSRSKRSIDREFDAKKHREQTATAKISNSYASRFAFDGFDRDAARRPIHRLHARLA